MISLFVLGLLLLMVFWNIYYAAHWSRNLTVSLNFVQNYVYTGDQAQMTEQIENRKKLMLPILEISFHMDKRLMFYDCENTSVSDFAYKRDIFALLGHQRITRKLALDCTKRGCYRIDKSYLTSFSILHRKRFSIEYPADTELYVYAARVDVSDILFTCERLMGNIQCAKRLYEDPFAFSSIREYNISDPMNTINWKASARTGELMVNTFESTITEKVMIYLDMEDSTIMKYEYLIETSVSVAASLTQKLISRGMEVGLCVNTAPITDDSADPEIITIEPAGSKKHLSNIEQTLAKCKSTEKTMPFSSLSESPEDAVVIIISKNFVQNQSAIEAFIGKKRQAILVVPHMKNDPCNIKTSGNIRVIRREVEQS